MPADISIRRAAPGDEQSLGAVGVATFLESFAETIPGPDLIAHCQSQHSAETYRRFLTAEDPRYACWLAEVAGTGAPIGYAVTCPPDLPVAHAPQEIELKRIYVLSNYHGTGAGRALSEAADAHGRKVGAQHMLLGTYEQNHRAIAFYRREGYIKIGNRQFQVGGQLFDDIVMSKPL